MLGVGVGVAVLQCCGVAVLLVHETRRSSPDLYHDVGSSRPDGPRQTQDSEAICIPETK